MEKKDVPTITEHITSTLNEHEIRLGKVQKLQTQGKNPWPTYKLTTATIAQARTEFETSRDEIKVYSLAGRLVGLRDHGKTFFGHMQDRSGKIQIYFKKDEIGEQAFTFLKDFIDIGDIIWLNGVLFTTKTGEVTIKVKSFELLSKCLHPLPEKFHGLIDVEQRYRQRYLDLISNPESREKFQRRSKIVQAIREFLLNLDFLEVETPMLHTIAGGAIARPFVTHHNAYNIDLFLRIAPELHLKQLVVGGFERVFEINRNFRNEGISTRHNPEFTTLEFYIAHGDYKKGMELTEQLLQHVVLKNFQTTKITFQGKIIDFTIPFKRLTLEQSLIEIGELTPDQINEKNIDATIKQHNIVIPPGAGYGIKLFALFEALVEGKIVQPTFIIGHPLEVSPLAKRDEDNPNLTARAELFINGMEFANLYTELNDPIDQAERFKAQAQAKAAGDEEAHAYDAEFVKALEYGLPPTVGCGIGIDRLVMLLTDTTSIKDVILFPTLKPVKE
jgi:lysyl-tRNA synthetase class 2